MLTPIGRLLAAPVRPGVVTWLGRRTARRVPLDAADALSLAPEGGVDGDHATSVNRAVTLIGEADLAAIAAFLGLDAPVDPGRLRRNVVVRGLNLLALKEGVFTLGTATLAMSGACHPCSRMEEEFGPGGYNAVRGHGGITARIVAAGTVRRGDRLIRMGRETNALLARSDRDPHAIEEQER